MVLGHEVGTLGLEASDPKLQTLKARGQRYKCPPAVMYVLVPFMAACSITVITIPTMIVIITYSVAFTTKRTRHV